MVKECFSCGYSNDDQMRFCINCGIEMKNIQPKYSSRATTKSIDYESITPHSPADLPRTIPFLVAPLVIGIILFYMGSLIGTLGFFLIIIGIILLPLPIVDAFDPNASITLQTIAGRIRNYSFSAAPIHYYPICLTIGLMYFLFSLILWGVISLVYLILAFVIVPLNLLMNNGWRIYFGVDLIVGSLSFLLLSLNTPSTMVPSLTGLVIGLLLLMIGVSRGPNEDIREPPRSVSVKKTNTLKATKWFESKAISTKYNRTTLILCFIFGGIFGLHHFYVGRTSRGFLYSFTFGGYLIGWFLDLMGNEGILGGNFLDSEDHAVHKW